MSEVDREGGPSPLPKEPQAHAYTDAGPPRAPVAPGATQPF